MAYTGKTNWQNNEIVEAIDMNRIEQGIKDAHQELIEVPNKINDKIDEHNTNIVDSERHGLRIHDGKLQFFNGTEWIEIKSGSEYHVGNIANFNAKPDDTQITLTWEDPPDVTIDDSSGNPIVIARWKGTKILRKTGSYPQNENDGVLVVDNGIRNQYESNGFIDIGLSNNIEYFYMAFPYTEDGVYTVDDSNRVSAIPTEIKIYGIQINETNTNPSTSVSYTDDALGLTPASGNNGSFNWGDWENIIKEEFGIAPCLLSNNSGDVNYYIQFNDFTKKLDGSVSNLTGTDGDVMIEFSKKLWWKFSRIGSNLKIQLSAKQFDGAICPAFEIENGYNQVPIYPLFLTQILYLLMFKNLDSQTALGRGWVDSPTSPDYANTGGTNAKTFCYGENTGKLQMKFLGMEDYWGNRRWWIDGCFYNASRNMLIGKGSFNDTGAGYTDFGQAMAADGSGYIDKVQGGDNTGFIPKSFAGASNQYYCDNGNVIAGRLPYFGGHRANADTAGAFYLISNTASSASATIGGRLFYTKGDKIYIGAYLGVNQGDKLRSISGSASENNKTIGAFRTLARANN